jgi:putative ABC transport system permease protein
VVAHQRESSLAERGREQIYFTDGYLGSGVVQTWAIRVPGNPAQYAGLLRAEVAKMGSRVSLNRVDTMDTLVGRAQSETRFTLLLIALFAIVAVLLAAVGLYGVLSTVVRQRTAEIGVRMAMGAAPGRIFQLVIGQGLRLSMIGVVLGFAAAWRLSNVMASMLVGVKPTDPMTFAGVALLFLVISTIASWLPALRAAGLEPTAALRQE